MKLLICCLLAVTQALAGRSVNHRRYQAPQKLAMRQSQNLTQEILPLIELPYGTWQAQSYDVDADLYIFKNIRFAAPPVGELRFAKPAVPAHNSTLQDGSYGPTCIGAGLQALLPVGSALTGISPSVLESTLSVLQASLANDPSNPLAQVLGIGAAEDCLFLDIYVPRKALDSNSTLLPVINYIYGGGYIGGAKEGLYDGTPLVKQSGGNVIYVAANYRLAGFGFLAGTTVEREGTPNAALWDQRAVLEWIQNYIHLVGGDREQVSAWGESAGGGSIEHHLIQFGGQRDPLFRKAIIQSPAFLPAYDRRGTIEDNYKTFEAAAGCAGKGLACLRNQSSELLNNASTLVINTAPSDTFGWGPVPDGCWVRQSPALEFATGHYWRHIDSLILSHVSNEGQVFVDPNITTNAAGNAWLESIYPNAGKAIEDAIKTQYPPVTNSTTSKYKTEFDRLRIYTQDSTFTCNVRFLSDAYLGRTYNVQYSRGKGLHGSDIGADFYDPFNLVISFLTTSDQSIAEFAPTYQSYLTSHARTGDPNSFRESNIFFTTIEWPKVENSLSANQMKQVLYAGDEGYSLFSDNETERTTCSFWLNLVAALTDEGGYAPSGSVVSTNITGVNYDIVSASRNYFARWS